MIAAVEFCIACRVLALFGVGVHFTYSAPSFRHSASERLLLCSGGTEHSALRSNLMAFSNGRWNNLSLCAAVVDEECCALPPVLLAHTKRVLTSLAVDELNHEDVAELLAGAALHAALCGCSRAPFACPVGAALSLQC